MKSQPGEGEWRIEMHGDDRLILRAPNGEGHEGGPVSRKMSRLLSEIAFEHGATSVKHAYDLVLTEK